MHTIRDQIGTAGAGLSASEDEKTAVRQIFIQLQGHYKSVLVTIGTSISDEVYDVPIISVSGTQELFVSSKSGDIGVRFLTDGQKDKKPSFVGEKRILDFIFTNLITL